MDILESLKKIYKERVSGFFWKVIGYGAAFYFFIMILVFYYANQIVLQEAGFGTSVPNYSEYEQYIMNQLYDNYLSGGYMPSYSLAQEPEDFDFESIPFKSNISDSNKAIQLSNGMMVAAPGVSKSSVENYDEISGRAKKAFNKYIRQRMKNARKNVSKELAAVICLAIAGPVIIFVICYSYKRYYKKKQNFIENGKYMISKVILVGKECYKTKSATTYYIEVKAEDSTTTTVSVGEGQYDAFEAGKTAYLIKIDDDGLDNYECDVVWDLK